jgi:hypothetical protein
LILKSKSHMRSFQSNATVVDFINFKGDLQEHYAKDAKTQKTQISYAGSINQQGFFTSIVSIVPIDNAANIRAFTGLPKKTKKLSEHSAAEIALSENLKLSSDGFVDSLKKPALLVNTTRNPQNPIGDSSSISRNWPRNLEIGASSSISNASQQSNNIHMDEPSCLFSPYNTKKDLQHMLNLFLPKTMSPSVPVLPRPTMVE